MHRSATNCNQAAPLLPLCCLYGFLYIHQVYVIVFRLVRHICGRLSRCVYLCSCFFMSSILVRALNMAEASILVSLFIYAFLIPGCHVVLFSRYCVLVFPSAFVFIMSANFVLMFIVVTVSVCCSPIIEVFILFVISFHPPFVWLFIIFATSLSGFFWILFHMFSLFFVVMEYTLLTIS